jgi:signal transduction histidine kinase
LIEVDYTPVEVILKVKDNGPGIPLGDQPHIFERFYRVHKDRSRDAGGTGLGLSIVKHTAQSHGGNVELESSPGQGATFIVRLPRVDV